MAERYDIHRITVETRGNPGMKVRIIDTQRDMVKEDMPANVEYLSDLKKAEKQRAAKARRFQDGSAIGALLGGSESDRIAKTSLSELTSGLPSGSVVAELISEELDVRFVGN